MPPQSRRLPEHHQFCFRYQEMPSAKVSSPFLVADPRKTHLPILPDDERSHDRGPIRTGPMATEEKGPVTKGHRSIPHR